MCGIFGAVVPGGDAARIAAVGLFALQHRGQESAGIAASDGEQLMLYKDLGLDRPGPRRAAPAEPPRPAGRRPLPLLDDRLHGLGERPADAPPGPPAGARDRPQREPRQHPRAAGAPHRRAEPPPRDHRHGAPHGAPRRRAGGRHRRRPRPRAAGRPRGVQPGRPRRAAGHRGARPPRLPAARPGAPAGGARGAGAVGRPRRRRRGWVLSSETVGLDVVGADFVRDVEPGELVILEPGAAPRSVRFAEARPALCVFELIYFARPDSVMEGRNLYEVRRRMGMELAAEHAVAADLVMPVPDTGGPAAAGYAEASGIPYREGMYRNRYAGRTFIQPSQAMRHRGVTVKLNPAARRRPRPAPRRRRRLDRPRHDHAGDRRPAAAGRRRRGPRPDQRPADLPSLLLRDRHPGRDRADRRPALRGRDPGLHRRRHARLPVDPGAPRGRSTCPYERFCFACFDGRYPEPVPYDAASRKFVLEEVGGTRG